MATNTELIAQIYIGFYDRAPDPVGLQYWIGRLEAGVSVEDIGNSFAASPEASGTYPYFKFPDLLTPDDFLEQVYLNVFGRKIDADGLAYYSARMEAGETAGSVIASILGNAASNDGSPDQAFLQNKVDAGLHWSTLAATTNANIYQENGRLTDHADASAHGILDGITADPITVEAASAATETYFTSAGPDLIYTLTNASNVQTGGVDVIHGADGADFIRAILPNSLDSTDIIDGGKGNDVLNISAGAIALGAAPIILNVETINNNNTALTYMDLSNVTGVKQINSSADAAYSNASLDTVFGISGSTILTVVQIGITASLAGTNDTLHLAVNGAPLGIFATADAALTDTSPDIEHITLEANGDAAPADAVNLIPFTGLETLTVTGAGDVVIFNVSTHLEMFDASAATGNVTVNLRSSPALETATTGSGDDIINFDAQGAVIDMGAGDDFIDIGNSSDGAVIYAGDGADVIGFFGTANNVTINGGAGADVFALYSTGAAKLIYTAHSDSTYVNFDEVNGFTSGKDTVDLSAFNLTGDTSALGTGNTTQGTIGALSNGAAKFFHVGGGAVAFAVVTFADASGTYVFADLDNDGSFNAVHDLVIQMTGVVPLAIGDFVFA